MENYEDYYSCRNCLWADACDFETVTVDGITYIMADEKCDDFSPIDDSDELAYYLSAGTHSLKIKAENSEGTTRTLSYTITVISLSVTTTFSQFTSATGDVVFYYTPIGIGTKTVHFKMDGVEIGTAETTSTGRSQTYTIPAQAHGGHIFECYAEMTVDTVTVQSNRIVLGMIWIGATETTPAIVSTFAQGEATQGEALAIPYSVYDPMAESTRVELSIVKQDGAVFSKQTITVDRTPQIWALQEYPAGQIKFVIACGATSVELLVTVAESEFILEPVTDSLALEFTAHGRSNGEENPASWSYGDITATFDGFGWSTADGWITTASGETALRFLPGDTMSIPFTPFVADARETGYTLEVEMSTRDVRDYSTVVMSCVSGGRGFQVTTQEAEFTSEQTEVSMQFKEDERVRIAFCVEQKNLNRLIYVYINGIMCGANQYPLDDDFAQPVPVGLTIGAETCGIDLYRIRCYNKGLTRHEQLDNFICDRPTLADRIDAAKRNDILDEREEVIISKLPQSLPYMVITCDQLPQFKGDKKICGISYTNMVDSSKSFTASGVQIDVQGTSSAAYKKKNFKIKFKNGLTYTSNGEAATEYTVNGEAVATDFAGTSYITHDVVCEANDIVTVTSDYTNLSSSSSYYGYVKFTSTGTIETDAEVQDAPSRVTDGYKDGTGSIGGWASSGMRSYLITTVLPLIPESIRNRIVTVTKSQPYYNTSGSYVSSPAQTTEDDVWIPSYSEAFNGTYKALFSDNASRIKMRTGATSASLWWLRSADNYRDYFYCVDSSGSYNSDIAYYSYGVALGFCT